MAAALVAGALLALALSGDDPSGLGLGWSAEGADPFAYAPEREAELEARATAGHGHVIYEKSPGGVMATARRVARWRPLVDQVAAEVGVDADTLEGLVLLESAGRPEVTASDDLEGAVGLTQILAETARSLLGMRVDVRRSERLTRRIARAERRGLAARARRVRARRRVVDERFDPRRALAGTGRYLEFALDRLGREDLAFVSYHMGVGNLERAIAAYGEEEPEDLSYVRLYFDSTPERHEAAHRFLSQLGDDSATYLWRVLASREIMRLWREDRGELERLARLHGAKASAEEVLHPPGSAEAFAGPEDLEAAYSSGELVPFPDRPVALGLRRARRMGELAGRLDAERRLYRGLRPAALALALHLGARVRELAGTRAPLTVTSTVRDAAYQRLLARRNRHATRNRSIHAIGYAFDVRRRYPAEGQAAAFQFMLDRLQSLSLIAWIREPAVIHIAVSPEAAALGPPPG